MKAGGHKRTAFLVLGMHRSGTSAFAGTLAHLGLTLPRELMAPDPSNAHGYFESWELAGLHNRVLGAAGSRWDDPSPIADAWFEGPSARACAGEIVGLLDREFSEAPAFAIKDPRLCRIVPVWRAALREFDAAVRVVLPLRHPTAIAQSLAARDGLRASESQQLWLRHLLDAERMTRDLPRSFVMFDDLLDDWRGTVSRLAAQLDFVWPRPIADAAAGIERFLDPHLRHYAAPFAAVPGGDPVSDLAHEAWEAFVQLARHGSSPEAFACLGRLRIGLDESVPARRMPLALETLARPLRLLMSKALVRRARGSPKTGSFSTPKAGE